MTPQPGSHQDPPGFGWLLAAVRAVVIVLYFVAATVALPSWVLQRPALAAASPTVVDAVAVAVWGSFMVLGLWGLRSGQRRGWL